MAAELWVLLATWVLGYGFVASLLMNEYKTLTNKGYNYPINRFFDRLQDLKDEALAQIELAETVGALELIRTKYLKSEGLIRAQKDKVDKLAPEDRPIAGGQLIFIRDYVRQTLDAKREILEISLEITARTSAKTSGQDRPERETIATLRPIGRELDGLTQKIIYEVVPKNRSETNSENS